MYLDIIQFYKEIMKASYTIFAFILLFSCSGERKSNDKIVPLTKN